MDPDPGADDVPAGATADGAPEPRPEAPTSAPIEPGSLGPHPERHPDDLPPPERSGGRVPSGVLWALALAVVVLTIASWIAFSTESSSTSSPDDSIVRLDPNATVGAAGLNAPDVSGKPVSATPFTTFSGSTSNLTAYAGTPMVVNFWASSCPPCITEMPAFEAVHQAAAGDVAFVGLAVKDQEDAARSLAERTGVTYDLGFDPSGQVIVDLGGVALPTTVFVGADGSIVEAHPGELDATELRDKIRGHFGIEVPGGS